MQPKLHHIVSYKSYDYAPPFGAGDTDEVNLSQIDPSDSELSESDWIEVVDGEWSDENLMDYARPGRRTRSNSRRGTSNGETVEVRHSGRVGD
jgi:hypothetical protein